MASGFKKVKESFVRFLDAIATFFKNLFKKRSDDKMGENPDFDEDLGPPAEEPAAPKPVSSKTPAGTAPRSIASKTPAAGGGKDVSVYFQSTIGPGEKKQKLLVNTGNQVGAIKQTVGNMFGLDPNDFHLSHGGVTLDEGSPLSNYNVSDGDTLLLIPASTAGI
nr:ubiquitin-like domain-containing protein [Candidatus Sigynarchaeum springense]